MSSEGKSYAKLAVKSVLQSGGKDKEVAKKALKWQKVSQQIVCDEMNVHANYSRALFHDLFLRYMSDIDKQSEHDDSDVRPAKRAAYLAFWIRKVKPISNAYYLDDIHQNGRNTPWTSEIVDINERLAIRLAFWFICAFNQMGKLKIHKNDDDKAIPFDEKIFKKVMSEYCNQKLGIDGKSVLETLIHDMRYRSVGPHNLAYLFDQFVFRLSDEMDKEMSKAA